MSHVAYLSCTLHLAEHPEDNGCSAIPPAPDCKIPEVFNKHALNKRLNVWTHLE